MEGRRNSKIMAKSIYNSQKRIMAFLLSAAMILTNVGIGPDMSYGGTADQAAFEIRGADLVSAVEEAILNGHEVTAEDLDFTNGKTAEFENVFFNGKGAVYEVYPEIEGSSMEAELRVFVCLPQDADDMYMVTGDEEIILLYVNNGADTISCSTEITRIEDGQEKVKKTKRVTIRSYEDAFGDEEVNLISKPAEDTEGLETDESQETVTEETTAPGTDAGQEGTLPGEGGAGEGSLTEDESSGAPQETTTADGTAADATETSKPEETKANGASGENAEANHAAEGENSVKGDATDHKDEADAEKTDKEETEPTEAAEPIASISRHYAPVVADNEEEQTAGAEGTGTKKKENTGEEGKKEKETEKADPDVQDKPESPTEKSSDQLKGNGSADEPKGDGNVNPPAGGAGGTDAAGNTDAAGSTDAAGGTGAAGNTDATGSTGAAGGTDAAGNTAATGGTDAAGNTDAAGGTDAAGSTDAAGGTGVEDGISDVPSGTLPGTDASLPSESEQGTTAAAVEEDVKKAGTSDLVGMGYCSTAKVYTTTLNQLKAMEDFDGYKVTYTSYPEASARILEGARGVTEGESLTFGVKTQAGYSIDHVMVNDEAVEADSTENNEDGSQTAWYTVPEVYEEQNVEVYTLETLEHPAFDKSVEVNGVTIRITAPEGVLPLDTEIQAEEITEQVASVVTEKVSAEAGDGVAVSEVIAYDINLMYNGLKLDNSWATDENSYVTVSFSGDRIAQASKEADQIEILHVETPTEEVEAVSAKAELEGGGEETDAKAEVPVLDHLTANNVSVDSEGRQELDVSGDASVGQIDFQTNHFSAFTVVFKNSPHLIIANELSDDSTGAGNLTYTYTVTITDTRENTNVELYRRKGDDEAEKYEYKKDANDTPSQNTEGGLYTNTYTFNLEPGEQMKIGNIGPNATYEVKQTVDETMMAYNTLLGTTTVSKGVDWTQVENSSGDEGQGTETVETVPYGYKYAQGEYGSLMARASALLEAHAKCKNEDEVWELLKNGGEHRGHNDMMIQELLYDYNGGATWPLAADEGFSDVVEKARENLAANKKGDVSYLHIYFRTTNVNKKINEIVPYLSPSNSKGNWQMSVVYNSTKKCWYQTNNMGYTAAGLRDKSVDKIIEFESANPNDNQKGKWAKLLEADFVTQTETTITDPNSSAVGSFMENGFARSITITFKNKYEVPQSDNTGGDTTDNPSDGSTDTPIGDSSNGNSSGGSTSEGSSGGGTTTAAGNAGRYQASDAQNGPGAVQNAQGAAQSIIEPSAVPLASLPADASAAASQAMTIIDDGEIPMSAIPKTGNRANSVHELSFILSGVLLAVYTALGKKRKIS